MRYLLSDPLRVEDYTLLPCEVDPPLSDASPPLSSRFHSAPRQLLVAFFSKLRPVDIAASTPALRCCSAFYRTRGTALGPVDQHHSAWERTL